MAGARTIDRSECSLCVQAFFRLVRLRRLSLADNDISRIPAAIGNLAELAELDLSHNGAPPWPWPPCPGHDPLCLLSSFLLRALCSHSYASTLAHLDGRSTRTSHTVMQLSVALLLALLGLIYSTFSSTYVAPFAEATSWRYWRDCFVFNKYLYISKLSQCESEISFFKIRTMSILLLVITMWICAYRHLCHMLVPPRF